MNDGYMDAAAVPVPDAGDDTLRDEMARTITASLHGGRWIDMTPRKIADALLPLIREHTAKAELRADARARVDEIKQQGRAEKAEAAIERVRVVWREHTDSNGPAPNRCVCRACQMAHALDGTEATP